MRLIDRSELFILLIFFGFWVLFFSIWGIIFNKDWNILILTLYVLLIFSSVIITVLKSFNFKLKISKIEEFEKKLKGGLYHFKCPICKGIFAIKESTNNNDKKSVKIIFLLVGPENNPGLHIKLLSRISRLMSNEELRNNLIKSKNNDEAFDLIHEEENYFFEID